MNGANLLQLTRQLETARRQLSLLSEDQEFTEPDLTGLYMAQRAATRLADEVRELLDRFHGRKAAAEEKQR